MFDMIKHDQNLGKCDRYGHMLSAMKIPEENRTGDFLRLSLCDDNCRPGHQSLQRVREIPLELLPTGLLEDVGPQSYS